MSPPPHRSPPDAAHAGIGGDDEGGSCVVLTSEEATTIANPGWQVAAVPLALKPTINVLIDPLVQRLAPDTYFFIQPSTPSAVLRFAGPQNFAGQEIRIE